MIRRLPALTIGIVVFASVILSGCSDRSDIGPVRPIDAELFVGADRGIDVTFTLENSGRATAERLYGTAHVTTWWADGTAVASGGIGRARYYGEPAGFNGLMFNSSDAIPAGAERETSFTFVVWEQEAWERIKKGEVGAFRFSVDFMYFIEGEGHSWFYESPCFDVDGAIRGPPDGGEIRKCETIRRGPRPE